MLCIKRGIELTNTCTELDCRFLPACMNNIIIDLSNIELVSESDEEFPVIKSVEDHEDYEESDYVDTDEDVVYGEDFEYTDEE